MIAPAQRPGTRLLSYSHHHRLERILGRFVLKDQVAPVVRLLQDLDDPREIGTRYQAPSGTPVATPDKTIAVQSLVDAQGRGVLDFGAPILFQGNKIGDVRLGVLEEPLSRVARLILLMLAILSAVTIAAAALVTYFLARRLAAPLRVLKLGLAEIGAGRYDFRINDRRSDELGEVFGAFDRAAAALEARYDAPPPPAQPPGEGTLIATAPASASAKVAS